MLPLALLPLELVLAGLVAAQTSAECQHEGLGDKLNNKFGQTPCTVQTQIFQACKTQDDSIRENCTCNTMYYNVCAACAACKGDESQTWGEWASTNTCGSNPAPFPSSQVQLDENMVPPWAHQQLTAEHDFDLPAAIESSLQPGLSRAAQIAVPIVVAVGVALLAGVLFWWYRRRKWEKHRNARMQTLSGESSFSHPRRWAHELWLRTRSNRLRPSRKDSDWEIDDDNRFLDRGVRSTYQDPYSREEHELGVPHTSSHIRETSSSSLLPNIEFPGVRRVPTFLERFIKFKDGIRKSASYKSKYVSPISPDHTFRIDGSAANSPTTKKFNDQQDLSPSGAVASHSGSGSGTSFHPHRVSTVREEAEEDIPGGSPVIVERSDFDPQRQPSEAEFPSGVLVISRDGEDFNSDWNSTVAPGARTPWTARSAYSGSAPPLSAATTQASWMPTPRRASTSSTVSGAYPHELRKDPDLSAPPSWANKFPAPPQLVPRQAPTSAPPEDTRMLSADGAMFPSPARTS